MDKKGTLLVLMLIFSLPLLLRTASVQAVTLHSCDYLPADGISEKTILLDKIKYWDECPVCKKTYVGTTARTEGTFKLPRAVRMLCKGFHPVCEECHKILASRRPFKCPLCKNSCQPDEGILIQYFNDLVGMANDIRTLKCTRCQQNIPIREVLGNWHHCNKPGSRQVSCHKIYKDSLGPQSNREQAADIGPDETGLADILTSRFQINPPLVLVKRKPPLNQIARLSAQIGDQPVDILITPLSNGLKHDAQKWRRYKQECRAALQGKVKHLNEIWPAALYEEIIEESVIEQNYYICILPEVTRLYDAGLQGDSLRASACFWNGLSRLYQFLAECHRLGYSFGTLSECDIGWLPDKELVTVSVPWLGKNEADGNNAVSTNSKLAALYFPEATIVRKLQARECVLLRPYEPECLGVLIALLRNLSSNPPSLESWLIMLDTAGESHQDLVNIFWANAQPNLHVDAINPIADLIAMFVRNNRLKVEKKADVAARICGAMNACCMPPAQCQLSRIKVNLLSAMTLQLQPLRLCQMLADRGFDASQITATRHLTALSCNNCNASLSRILPTGSVPVNFEDFGWRTDDDQVFCYRCIGREYLIPCQCSNIMVLQDVSKRVTCMFCRIAGMNAAFICQNNCGSVCEVCARQLIQAMPDCPGCRKAGILLKPRLCANYSGNCCSKCQGEISAGSLRFFCVKCKKVNLCTQCFHRHCTPLPWNSVLFRERDILRSLEPVSKPVQESVWTGGSPPSGLIRHRYD
ncbi:hypothetical protein [Spongorhabdus nitratireducens]